MPDTTNGASCNPCGGMYGWGMYGGYPYMGGCCNPCGNNDVNAWQLLFTQSEGARSEFRDLSLTVRDQGASNGVAIEKVGASIVNAIQASTMSTQLLVNNALAQLLQQASENAKDAVILADRNHDVLLRELLRCCCEQEKLTIEQATETRQLIQSLRTSELETEVADLKMAAMLHGRHHGHGGVTVI